MAEPAVYGSSWNAFTMRAAPARPPLTVELDVDVCVIGAGLAGLTAAREVARRGWSVAVLEAKRVASAASGRNTGFVLPGFGAEPETIIARVGIEDARELWALSERGAEYVRRTIAQTGMSDAQIDDSGWLYVSKTDNHKELSDYVELLNREFNAGVEYWPVERTRSELKSPLYFSAVNHPRAFTIHPLNYAQGLAAAAEAAGARIFEQTPALQIDPTGVRKRIVTPSARLRAGHVVLAGNVDIGGLMPALARTLVPVSTYVVVTEKLGDKLRDAITYPGAVSDGDLANNHYRVVDGDRLMWSGRSTVWSGSARMRSGSLRRDIQRAYPQLGPVKVGHPWTGTLGITVHRMPQIGELSPGLWLASGFGGHGLNTTAMAGELVAAGIVDGDRTWRLFSPFELVWTGGPLGRAAAQVYAWSYMAGERAKAHFAREREAAKLKADAAAAAAEAAAEQARLNAEAAAPPVALAEAEPAPSAMIVGGETVAAEPAADDAVAAETLPEKPRRKRRKERGRNGDGMTFGSTGEPLHNSAPAEAAETDPIPPLRDKRPSRE